MSIIGIDAGSTTVKIVEINDKGKITHKLILNKLPVVQAIDVFINKEKINKMLVTKFVLTGVGMDEVENTIFGIPVIKVDEFVAIGTGGLYLAKQKKALVVSIGTGTAFVKANGKKFKHIGGSGVGGGSLIKLCEKYGNVKSFSEINSAILNGNLKNVDLMIEDVTKKEIKGLPKDTTSSNFGKLDELATENDIMAGFANMIFETIGVMAVFATRKCRNKNIIVIGNVATMSYIKKVLKRVEKLHKGVNFIIPKQAEFATVIGAIKAIK